MLVSIQVLMTVFALVMSRWATHRWLATLGFTFLGASAIAAELSPAWRYKKSWHWTIAVAWIFTLIVPISSWLPEDRYNFKGFFSYYYAVLAWTITAMLLPASHRGVGALVKGSWRGFMFGWAVIGTLAWIATAYLHNEPTAFHVGLLLALAAFVAGKLVFDLPGFCIQLTNTVILFISGLLLIGLFFNPDRKISADLNGLKKYYCYRTAKENWKAHDQWCEYFNNSYNQEVDGALLIKNPDDLVPIRVRSNSYARFIECDVFTSSKGFRGREIAEDKSDIYRIVAIGESTTFGFTIDRDGKPWPELFEQTVRERLKPNRPIEVINAGIPGITLPENLRRFADQILPLKPDMIICYHGINGFSLMDSAVPPLRGTPPPKYYQRPLRLLADSEYNLKLFFYRQTQSCRLFFQPPTFSNLLETKYAAAYEDLIQIAKTNNIRLAIANFSLAVNAQSPPELLDFFRRRTSATYWYLRGNIAHNQLVRQLVQKHPEVTFVDAQPHIDGEEEKFLDLMHLTQEGDQQLADNFFAGLRSVLEREIVRREAASLQSR